MARVYRQDPDNFLVFVRYLSPFVREGEQFGVPPCEVAMVSETYLSRN